MTGENTERRLRPWAKNPIDGTRIKPCRFQLFLRLPDPPVAMSSDDDGPQQQTQYSHQLPAEFGSPHSEPPLPSCRLHRVELHPAVLPPGRFVMTVICRALCAVTYSGEATLLDPE
jgi:hypothetical protein